MLETETIDAAILTWETSERSRLLADGNFHDNLTDRTSVFIIYEEDPDRMSDIARDIGIPLEELLEFIAQRKNSWGCRWDRGRIADLFE